MAQQRRGTLVLLLLLGLRGRRCADGALHRPEQLDDGNDGRRRGTRTGSSGEQEVAKHCLRLALEPRLTLLLGRQSGHGKKSGVQFNAAYAPA